MTQEKLFETAPEELPIEEAIVAHQVSPARQSDPETSHEAAAAYPEVRGQQRLAVYEYLLQVGEAGASDYQISEALGILRTSAGKRRKDLCDLGYVTETDRRAPTDTGSSAVVWAIKPEILREAKKHGRQQTV